MKFFLNSCNLYLLVWIIQLIHTPLNLYGDSMSVLVLLGLYVWSLYYCYLTITKYKLPPFLKVWSVLFLLFSIYAFIRIINPFDHSYGMGMNSRMFLMEHWTSMLPIYPFFVFSKKGLLNENIIRKWAIVLIGVAICQYYFGRVIAISKISAYADETAVTNNMGYFIAMVMPLMYFFRNKPMIQYIGNAILMMFVLLAVKRGAILVGIISLLIQVVSTLRKKENVKTLWALLIIIVFIIAGFYYIRNNLMSNDYFMLRLENTLEGNDSNRSVIYNGLIHAFFNSDNPFTILFGNGADGTILLMKTQAHNDWIEIMVDMGILGFVTFFVFWIRAFSDIKRIRDKDLRISFFMVVTMLFVRTFFSMSINDINIPSTLMLGYCLASINNNYQNKVQINYDKNSNCY